MKKKTIVSYMLAALLFFGATGTAITKAIPNSNSNNLAALSQCCSSSSGGGEDTRPWV